MPEIGTADHRFQVKTTLLNYSAMVTCACGQCIFPWHLRGASLSPPSASLLLQATTALTGVCAGQVLPVLWEDHRLLQSVEVSS